jgi:DNA-binding MarR family transcriptional regulator
MVATSRRGAGARRAPLHGDEYACARAWVALTAAHAQVSGLLASALARECGLTINEFEILLRLDQAGDGGVRLTELLTAVPLTQPALSRAVARLAGRGLLARGGAPGDGRGVLIKLTAAGAESLRAAIPVHAQVIGDALLAKVSPREQDLLAEILGRIASGNSDKPGQAGRGPLL